MCLIRPTTIIAAFLIVAVSIPPSLCSQTAPRPSQPRQRQPKRSQRADALASAIKELLEIDPLAPRSPLEKASEENSSKKGNASEDEDKPPADDAPIKELIAYWYGAGYARSQSRLPSEKVRRRLLEACEDYPEILYSLVHYLPENTDTHDRLYKLLNEESEGEETWKPRVRGWLRRNSEYFRDDLIKAALAYGANEDLRAWARLDWNSARPILESLATTGKPTVTPLALALLYEHAEQESDSARAETYRALLKAIVENRQADWDTRGEALASLMSVEWGGQEEWFVSRFADPTLSGLREDEIEAAAKGEITIDKIDIDDLKLAGDGSRWDFQPNILAAVLQGNTVFRGNADRWIPVISNLVGHNQRTVHLSAVQCLYGFLIDKSVDEKKKKDIAQKLIPWLTEPDWATKEDRSQFIGYLSGLKMPELVPGLIWILDYDESTWTRAAAAEALAEYRDPRAIPVLCRALEKEKIEENREKIVTTLAECGGLSDEERAVAVEAYARMVATDDGAREIDLARDVRDPNKSLPLKVSVGRILNNSETIQATEGLALRLIEKAKSLRATEPDVAREILRSIEAAPLRVAEVNLVERIGAGWADVDSITLALETRDALIKSAGAELYDLVKEGGYAAGVAAAILNDEREWKSILEKGPEKGDAKAQLALLASARYTRDKLPVELVARLLNSPNHAMAKAIVKAAESYLEIEDSPEARKVVLARHPGEAYIVGDITAINTADRFTEATRSWEETLRKEMRGRNAPETIYAVGKMGPRESIYSVIIRVRGGKAEISVHETEGRRNVRWLTGGELDELKSFTSRQEIEDLGPESYARDGERFYWRYDYVRLTKEGGRRIILNNMRRAPKNPTPHEELSGLFYRLNQTGEFTARYDIEDKIPGVEVVFADKNQSVLKVCGEGGEMRALIEEKGAEYRRGGEKAAPEWREISSGKPGEVRDEPSACRTLKAPSSAPKHASVINHNPIGQPSKSDVAMFYATGGEDGGIWKAEPGMTPVKIASSNYNNPVIMPDGKWLVSNKWLTEEGNVATRLVRLNLQSGEEFVIPWPQPASTPSLVYVAAHGKVLATGGIGGWNNGYLIEPETGTLQPVKGELGAMIATLTSTPQQGGAPNLFWTAIYDLGKRATKFGKYDSKNFTFTPLLEFPELTLINGAIWVDEAGGKIWFAYQGHLLRLPIPSQTK